MGKAKRSDMVQAPGGSAIESGAELAAQGFKFVHDLKLADGEGIRGTFRGPGAPREMVDDKDGTVRAVPTFLIEKGNVTYSIMAGVKLARLLGEVKPGAEVAVVRLGDVPIKGGKQRMTDYTVGVRE